MNKEYKHQLAKKGKSICPECKRKTFVLYIDTETGNPLHSTVGRCDREVNCGYHYTPKQYFQDNNISFDIAKNFAPYRKPNPKPQLAPSYIDAEIFKQSLQGYKKNALVQYLCKIVGDEATRQAVERYYTGTSKNGGTVFWQIDMSGKIRTGKVIQYAADGHRRKDVIPQVGWAHTALKINNFNQSQCFFGEHLLNGSNNPVAVVESEKTAVIASIYLPQFIWLACGGSEGLNIDKCRCLKGRDVILYPDCGMFDKWNSKAGVLRTVCKRVSVSSLIEKTATEPERRAGFDLGDYLVRFSPSDFAKQPNPASATVLEAPKQADSKQTETSTAEPEHDEHPKSQKSGFGDFNTKQKPAYVSGAGILYIPTPPDRERSYTVYPSVEAYNKRSACPSIALMKNIDVSGMKQVFINSGTLTV